jgi:hypothetical protein
MAAPLGAAINGVIGAPRLLSIEHSHGVASRLGLRVSRTFVSLGILALCALVLAFDGEEAQAQQLPQAQHPETSEQVAGKIFQTPVEATPTEETSLREARPAITSLVEPASQPALVKPESSADQPSPAASNPVLAEPGLPIGDTAQDSKPVSGSALRSDPVSGLTTVPVEQDGPTTLGDPYLAPPDPGPTTTEPAPEPVPVAAVEKETAPVDPDHSPLDFEPEPVAIEESDPLPLLAGEASATERAVLYTEKEGYSYQPYVLVETLEGTLQNAAANASGILVDEALSWSTAVEGEGLVGTTFAGLFYGENAGHLPASEPNGETRSSSTGTGPEWPLQDSGPQPVSPFTPPAGSSYSLSGGQVGAGVVALLFCVLASGLILLRREFKLTWNFCELPKPSSVLLLPPERPG